MSFELIISSLQDKKHRITPLRKSLIKIFSQHPYPLSVNEIETKLSEFGLVVNKTTIYREVQFLLSHQLINEIFLTPQKISYESAQLPHHHHLICNRCGQIENVTKCLTEGLEKDVLKQKGFKIHRHILEFYGTCANCLKKSRSELER